MGFGARWCSSVACLLAMVSASCGGSGATGGARGAGDSGYVDHLPAPGEPLVTKTGEGAHYGGRFVIVTSTAPNTFNPVTSNTGYSFDLIKLMFAPLVRIDAVTKEPEPWLASSWDCPADGLSCTFHLRHGTFFSDGHPISADDVLFSFRAMMDPASPRREFFIADGRPFEVTAPDPQTVVVRSPSPNGSLLVMVSAFVFVLPKHVLEPALAGHAFARAYTVSTPPEQLVSSGPWRLKASLPGQRTVLERNPYWFGVDEQGRRVPYLDELIVTMAPDANAAHLMLVAGDVDAVDEARPENFAWYEEHQKDQHLTTFNVGPVIGPAFIAFNLNTGTGGRPGPTYSSLTAGKWLRTAAFRRAVSMAIDRDAIIRGTMYGYGAKYFAYSTPGDRRWALPDVPHYDHDPDAARRVLASLGLADHDADGVLDDGGSPVSFVLRTSSGNGAANFIRDDLAKVGIKVIVQQVEFNTLIAGIRNDFRYDAAIVGVSPRFPDPFFARNFWVSTGSHNWNPHAPGPELPGEARVDELIDGITSSTDFETRRQMWSELNAIANEQAWLVWLPVPDARVPVRDRFANVRPAGPNAGDILWNSEEFFVRPTARMMTP